MSAPKWTPGPWHAHLPLSDYPADWRVRSDDYGEIANLYEDPGLAVELGRLEEIEANARLIAAAPEMFEALALCEGLAEEDAFRLQSTEFAAGADERLCKVRAALAKAAPPGQASSAQSARSKEKGGAS